MDLSIPLICLALNIYHEARSESILGQTAVTQVVMNRVNSSKYPDNICEVITDRHQFSWVLGELPHVPTETTSWAISLELAGKIMDGEVPNTVSDFMFYHATWLCLEEAHKHVVSRTYGDHVFYR